MSEPVSAASVAACEVIVAMFVHGPERCRRRAVVEVMCADPFCSALHPTCEIHHDRVEQGASDV